MIPKTHYISITFFSTFT